MKSVIDDYKILNENSKNFKKINPKSKRKEKYPLVRLKPQKNNIRQDKNTINQKVILNNKLNSKKKEITKPSFFFIIFENITIT